MTILNNNFIGDRSYNEDKYFSKKINDNVEIFGIFDGHNGDKVADYVCKYFYNKLKKYFTDYDYNKLFNKKTKMVDTYENVEEEVYDFDENDTFKIIEKTIVVPVEKEYYEFDIERSNSMVKSLLHNLYHKCQHKIILNYEKLDAIKSGTTALVGIYLYKNLYVSNGGDTRTTIIDPDFKAIQISQDHNIKNISEKSRVLSLGGYFNGNYLFGRINLTRGFGDLWQLEKFYTVFYNKIPSINKWTSLKSTEEYNNFIKTYDIDFIISPVPDIHVVENYQQNVAIINATDGVWGCVSNGDMGVCLYNTYIECNNIDKSKEIINDILLNKILKLWHNKGKSIDNITYIIKCLNKIF